MSKENKNKKDNYSIGADVSFPFNNSKNSTSVPLFKTENTFTNLNNNQKGHTEIEYRKLSNPKINKQYVEDKIEEQDEAKNDDKFRIISKREKISLTDSEDDASDKEQVSPWILTPENNFKRVWDIMISIIILYTSIVLPYKIAFNDEDTSSVLDILLDVILFIDIILCFFSAYIDSEENVIKKHKKIIITYLKGWFIIDSVSIFPISYIMGAESSLSKFNNLTRIGKIPRLYKLLRLAKMMRMLKMVKRGGPSRITKFFLEKLKVNSNIERLLVFIFSFLLLSHMSACIWFFVAKLQDLDPDCWVTRLNYIDAENYEIYIVSFYWTLTTVTTVGYGDISANTTEERIFSLFIMSFGVLMYSFAIGALSSIVSSFDTKNKEMNAKLLILASIRKEFNLNDDLYDKVRKVIKYDSSKNQKDKMNFLSELPNKLRIELSQEMHDKVIQNLYFFRDQPKDFIAYVAPLLKPVKFTQGDYLYKNGDNLDEMYFVIKGTVVFCLDKFWNEKEIREIKKNNSFGEIEMCLNKQLTYNIKIKSRICELFILKKDDFLKLSVNFKDFIEKFLKKSLYIFLKLTEEINNINELLKNGNEQIQNDLLTRNLHIINEEKSDRDSVKGYYKENEMETQNMNVSVNDEKKSLTDDEKTTNKKLNKIQMNDENLTDIEKANLDKQAMEAENKFFEKCENILNCLDKVNIKFDIEEDEDPRIILMKLKNSEIDVADKKGLIDKLEIILSDALKRIIATKN